MGQSLVKGSAIPESKTLEDLCRLAAARQKGNLKTQIIRHDSGTDGSLLAEKSTLRETDSTREIEQQALQLSSNDTQMRSRIRKIGPDTEKWLATVEGFILDGRYDEANKMAKAKEKLSVDHEDICVEFISAGLEFQACVKGEDAGGAWDRLWHTLRLMLALFEEDGGTLEAQVVERVVAGSLDELYELLASEKRFWDCTLCVRAGIAINTLFSNVEGSTLCFKASGVSTGGGTSDNIDLGAAHRILYRLLGVVQHRSNSTTVDDLLADQSFQLLLLHDNILFNSMMMEDYKDSVTCLLETWKEFDGEYFTAIEKLRKWTAEFDDVLISGIKMEGYSNNVEGETSAAGEAREQGQDYHISEVPAELSWKRELEIKSLGFVGLYLYGIKDYTAAETNLFMSIRLALEHHNDFKDSNSLLENVIYLFGNTFFDTLRVLKKFDSCNFENIEHQLSLLPTLPFKFLLEYQYGKWLFEGGHTSSDKGRLARSLGFVWESGRELVEVGYIENSIDAYRDSIGIATIMSEEDFDKPWEILEDALGYSEIRDDEKSELWEVLWDVAQNSCKTIQERGSVERLDRAIRGLEKTDEFALQGPGKERRIFFHAHIQFSMATLLVGYASCGIPGAAGVQLEKAICLLEEVCKQLEEWQELDGAAFLTEAIELLKMSRELLRQAFGLADKHRQAAEISLRSRPRLLIENQIENQRPIFLKAAEAISLSSLGSHYRALKTINEAILEVQSSPELRDDPEAWTVHVSLLFNRSSIHNKAGQKEKCLADMEDAKQRCKYHDFAFGANMDVFEGFMRLLETYIDGKDYESALQLVKDIDTTARIDFARGPTGEFVEKFGHWEHLKAKVIHLVTLQGGESESAGFWKNMSTDDMEAEAGLVFTPFLMDAMCKPELPLEKRLALIDGEARGEKMGIRRDAQLSENVQTPWRSEIHKNLFQCYLHLAERDGDKAVTELQTAINSLEMLPSLSRKTDVSADLGRLYALQALVYGAMRSVPEANSSIDRARVQMQKIKRRDDPMYLHAKNYVEFYVNSLAPIAADAGRHLLARFTTAQSQIPDSLEFGWVQSLDDKAFLYRRMERIAVDRYDLSGALLWAERGQMRLFMHLVESSKGLSGTTTDDQECMMIRKEGRFDQDDEYAIQILFKTIESFPKNVAIVKLSYFEPDQSLVVYLLSAAEENRCIQVIPDMGKEFGLILDSPDRSRQNFAQYMKDLLWEIKIKNDSVAKKYLSVLHRLLIKPFLPHLTDTCDTLVFSHHGLLSSVPLHALFDDSKFLIEQKRVCYTPSIRVLGYCHRRKNEYMRSCAQGLLKAPFIAGDPSPMGKNEMQLKHARKEAEAVAKILLGDKSRAYVGEAVTKQAVEDGLSNSCLTLLSTHFKDQALILRASAHQERPALSASDMQQTKLHSLDQVDTRSNTASIGNARVTLREENDIDSDLDVEDLIRGATMRTDASMLDEEVLTTAEISLLRVRSGVVVLDGCSTNEGEVSQEGWLGLGRALLLAGASMAILTLWSVNDESTCILVTSIFEIARTKQLDVLGSLKQAMVDMIENEAKDYKIYHWAPLIALGYPLMQLVP